MELVSCLILMKKKTEAYCFVFKQGKYEKTCKVNVNGGMFKNKRKIHVVFK